MRTINMKTCKSLVALTVLLTLIGCESKDSTEPVGEVAAKPTELEALAVEAYIYGYPMVYHIDEMRKASGSDEYAAAGPINTFGHSRKQATASDKFVTINNDSNYSWLQGDLTAEPLVVHIPATGDRYYVMQSTDAWTNNFAYPGKRATGGDEQLFLYAGPDWEGPVPDGMTVVRVPTNLFTIIGRFSVESNPEDVAAVNALQDDTWATPLSLYPDRPNNSARELGDRDFAPFNTAVEDNLVFWEKMRAWMKLVPPVEAERADLARFEPLGLLADESPYLDPSPELAAALKHGENAGMEKITAAIPTTGTKINGWILSTHLFDYNLDHFEVGAIGEDQWKIDDRKAAHLTRAVAARVGLWGNHAYEASYAQVYTDADGNTLDATTNRYRLHFADPLPVDAFWSVTMYDADEFYLVENEIDRYSIGDRTPGIEIGDDGSVTIYIQAERPGEDQEANWLPAPAGKFRPVLRMYLPGESILDESYPFPPIELVAGE